VKINRDFKDFISLMNKHSVEFVVVGSFALSFLGYPRATGDIDFWIRKSPENASRILKVLDEFGFGNMGVGREDFLEDKVIQLGQPPVRIDLMTELDGLTSEEIWAGRLSGKFGDMPVYYLGRDAFIRNKRSLGRHKDLADLEALGEKV
jgi:hypothetical protein